MSWIRADKLVRERGGDSDLSQLSTGVHCFELGLHDIVDSFCWHSSLLLFCVDSPVRANSIGETLLTLC